MKRTVKRIEAEKIRFFDKEKNHKEIHHMQSNTYVSDFYTETKTNITKFFVSGLTKLFSNKREAIKYSEQKRTYVYNVFGYVNREFVFLGYGVPS